MNVYTRIDGKLAKWVVDTDNSELARVEVMLARSGAPSQTKKSAAVLAVIDGRRSIKTRPRKDCRMSDRTITRLAVFGLSAITIAWGYLLYWIFN